MASLNFLAPGPFISFTVRTGVSTLNLTSDANSLLSGVPVSGTVIEDLEDAGCIALAYSPSANFRNLLDGGDATTNPCQRNCVGLATANQNTTAVANTPTWFMDRFFGVGASTSAILMGPVANTTVAGFNQWHSLQRKAGNTDTNPIYYGSIVEYLDVIRLQGQTITLSFWALAGANYSGGALAVKAYTGTGNNDTAANMVAGAWAGAANPLSTSQVITAGPVRYQFTFTVPTTATALGFTVGYTPTGTAAAADVVLMNGFQLEIGASASPFEFRDAQIELEVCQRYTYLIAEPASNVIVAPGSTITANNQTFAIPTPVQMLRAPTVTLATGGFKVAAGAAFAASAITAGTTHTPNMFSVTSALTASAGAGALLAGGAVASGGYILAATGF